MVTSYTVFQAPHHRGFGERSMSACPLRGVVPGQGHDLPMSHLPASFPWIHRALPSTHVPQGPSNSTCVCCKLRLCELIPGTWERVGAAEIASVLWNSCVLKAWLPASRVFWGGWIMMLWLHKLIDPLTRSQNDESVVGSLWRLKCCRDRS